MKLHSRDVSHNQAHSGLKSFHQAPESEPRAAWRPTRPHVLRRGGPSDGYGILCQNHALSYVHHSYFWTGNGKKSRWDQNLGPTICGTARFWYHSLYYIPYNAQLTFSRSLTLDYGEEKDLKFGHPGGHRTSAKCATTSFRSTSWCAGNDSISLGAFLTAIMKQAQAKYEW